MVYETTPLRVLSQTSQLKQLATQNAGPSLIQTSFKNLQQRHELFIAKARQILNPKHRPEYLDVSAASLNEAINSTTHCWLKFAHWCSKQVSLYQYLSKEASLLTELREPLTTWLTYLLNTVRRALSLCSNDTANQESTSKTLYILTSVAGKYEQLLQQQKNNISSEKLTFSNVRCLTTWKKCSSSFLPEQIKHSSAAWVSICHPLHTESQISVSIFLIDNGSKSGSLLALCRNVQPAEKILMFPPFRKGELKVLENSQNDAMVLSPISQHGEGITLNVMKDEHHWSPEIEEFLHCKDESFGQVDLRHGLKITPVGESRTGLRKSKTILGAIEPIALPVRSRLDPRSQTQKPLPKPSPQTTDVPVQPDATAEGSPQNDPCQSSRGYAANEEDGPVQSSDCPSTSELESELSFSSNEQIHADEETDGHSMLDLSRHQPSFAKSSSKRPSLVTQWSQKLLKKKSSFSGDEKSVVSSKASSTMSLPITKSEMTRNLSPQELEIIAASTTQVALPVRICRWCDTKWEHVADLMLEVTTSQNIYYLVGYQTTEASKEPVLLYQVACDGKISRTTAVDVHLQVVSKTGERQLLLVRTQNFECCQSLYGNLSHLNRSKPRRKN